MRTLGALLVLCLLSGCTAMVVGGAGVAAYEVTKDERPASVVASDSTITTKIRAKLLDDATVSVFNIGVRTYEGVVTLTGSVGSIAARNRAIDIASATSGVRKVDDRIRIVDKSKS